MKMHTRTSKTNTWTNIEEKINSEQHEWSTKMGERNERQRQQNKTNLSQRKKEPMKNVQWKMTRKMTHTERQQSKRISGKGERTNENEYKRNDEH